MCGAVVRIRRLGLGQRRKGTAHIRATVDAEARSSQQKITMMKRLRMAIESGRQARSVSERFVVDQKPQTLVGRLPEALQSRLADLNIDHGEVKHPMDMLKNAKDRLVDDKRHSFMSPALSRRPTRLRVSILNMVLTGTYMTLKGVSHVIRMFSVQKARKGIPEQKPAPVKLLEQRVPCTSSQTDVDQKILSRDRLKDLIIDVSSLRQRTVVT